MNKEGEEVEMNQASRVSRDSALGTLFLPLPQIPTVTLESLLKSP